MQEARIPLFLPSKVFEDQELDPQQLLDLSLRAKMTAQDEIELPYVDLNTPLLVNMIEEAKKNSLKLVHTLSMSDFVFDRSLERRLKEGIVFKVLIFDALSPSFLDRLKKLESYIDQFRFVFIIRKDWNYFTAFKSIPYIMRSQLYVDFPAKLQYDDPFYESEEIIAIEKKLKDNFLNLDIKSYNPNSQLYNDLADISLIKNRSFTSS